MTYSRKDKVVPVSVIIPCFNNQNSIERAVQSVIEQTHKPAEIIIVDDCSTDNSPAILDSIQKQYPEDIILHFNEINTGAATARNIGWEIAKQPFIALLDADDAWHKKKLELQYQFMLENPDIDISSHNRQILSNKNELGWPLHSFQWSCISKWYLLLTNPVITPSLMIKAEIPIRFEPGQRYMEDHYFLLLAAFHGAKLARMHIALAAIFKPSFGVKGLSAQLWQMQKNELNNYYKLYKKSYLNCMTLALLSIYSILKFLRRLLATAYYRLSD